jgi:hypothetical protein
MVAIDSSRTIAFAALAATSGAAPRDRNVNQAPPPYEIQAVSHATHALQHVDNIAPLDMALSSR